MYLEYGYCVLCKGRKADFYLHDKDYSGPVCSNCAKEPKKSSKQIYFEKLETLPILERVRRIERWIYQEASKC